MTEKSRAYIAAFTYAFIVGFAFLFVKMTLTFASPLDTLAHRFTIAFIAAIIFQFVTKTQLKINWRDIGRILPLSLLYPIFFFAFQVFGLNHTSSSEAGIIQATIPIFTLMLASLILKERATRGQLAFMSLSVFGVIYLFVMNGARVDIANLVGIALILVSSFVSALYNVFARKLTQQYSLVTLTYVMTFLGFVFFNILAIGSHVIDGTTSQFFLPFLHMKFLFAILYLGILSSLLTSFLSNYALSKIEAYKMSVFSNFATLLTIMAGVLFLQEAFHLYHLIGAIFIIIGVVGTNFVDVRNRNHKDDL